MRKNKPRKIPNIYETYQILIILSKVPINGLLTKIGEDLEKKTKIPNNDETYRIFIIRSNLHTYRLETKIG